jgi:Secretion system C-terminal sorting domain
MKILFAFLLTCIFLNDSFAQNKVNYWMGGINGGGIYFGDDTTVSFVREDPDWFWATNASISDSRGNLLFYTNGYRIFNRNQEVMQNGDQLDIGDYVFFQYGCNAVPDGAVIIPFPNDSMKYYLFYVDVDWTRIDSLNYLYPHHLYYAVIDMKQNSGLGAVDSGMRDISILDDTLTDYGMQAVKHANGKDWWLLCHEQGSSQYYRFLIDSQGIHGPYGQSIGITYVGDDAAIASPMKFNSDGTKFLHLAELSQTVELYDFDRCTGLLSNYHSFKVDEDSAIARGASFSPNDRFVYLSVNFNEIRQYDLTAPDITKSMQVVGTNDGISDPFVARYYLQQIGPDGKIYVTGYDQEYSVHLINYPNELGANCDFVQRGFKLIDSTDWFSGFTIVPDYALGPLAGSGCDTNATSIPTVHQNDFSHLIYPNPFIDKFQLNIYGVDNEIPVRIYDTWGRTIEQTIIKPNHKSSHSFFNLKGEPAGLYFLDAQTEKGSIIEKIVKQ